MVIIIFHYSNLCRSQWPRGLRRRSAAAHLMRWVRIPLEAWMLVVSVVGQRSLQQADHLSRGVLPPAERHRLWSRNLKNEEVVSRIVPQRHGGNSNLYDHVRKIWLIIVVCNKLTNNWYNYTYIRLTTGWTCRDRIPVRTRFSARPDRPWGPPNLL